MLSPLSSSWLSPPSSSCTVPVSTTRSSSESPCTYGSVPVEPPTSSSPTKTSSCWSGRGVSRCFGTTTPNAGDGSSRRRSTRGLGGPVGSKRSATVTPSAPAIRRSDAMLALDRPRSTWLRKLSLTPARSATSRSVQRRERRIARRRSPTSTSAATSGALDGIQSSSDPVEGKLKRPYGVAEVLSMRSGEESPEARVLAGLADGDERVAALDRVRRLGAGDGFGLAHDRDHGDPGRGAEGGLGECLADPGAVVGDRDPLDLQLAERHLEVLDDLRSLVGAADHGSELARLVVVEGDDRGRLLVFCTTEEVELALAVVVQDDREAAPGVEAERELRADAGKPRLLQIDRHRQPSTASLGARKRRRPIVFDSFINATPSVAVIST